MTTSDEIVLIAISIVVIGTSALLVWLSRYGRQKPDYPECIVCGIRSPRAVMVDVGGGYVHAIEDDDNPSDPKQPRCEEEWMGRIAW